MRGWLTFVRSTDRSGYDRQVLWPPLPRPWRWQPFPGSWLWLLARVCLLLAFVRTTRLCYSPVLRLLHIQNRDRWASSPDPFDSNWTSQWSAHESSRGQEILNRGASGDYETDHWSRVCTLRQGCSPWRLASTQYLDWTEWAGKSKGSHYRLRQVCYWTVTQSFEQWRRESMVSWRPNQSTT